LPVTEILLESEIKLPVTEILLESKIKLPVTEIYRNSVASKACVAQPVVERRCA